MTEDELAAIEARANAATAGPWYLSTGCGYMVGAVDGYPAQDVDTADNAEFIAHARTDVPSLVAEVRRLRGLVKEAYEEGYNNGYVTDPWKDQSWGASESRKALGDA